MNFGVVKLPHPVSSMGPFVFIGLLDRVSGSELELLLRIYSEGACGAEFSE